MSQPKKRLPRWSALFEPSALESLRSLSSAEPERNIVAALIPHISLNWAPECYRRTAAALQRSPKPDVVYIFGFNHLTTTSRIFHATRSPYVVGDAELEVCRDTLDRLERAAGDEDLYHDEMHAVDWTIENALPPLLVAYGSSWKLVPIIIEHRHQMFEPGNPNYLMTSKMVDAVAESVCDHLRGGRRVLLVAGVDLSHHGRFFGDLTSTPQTRSGIEAFDREYLELVFGLDAVGAERFLGKNKTRNDAIAAMSLVGRVASMTSLAHSGELLHFDHYFGREDDRFVTVASGFLLGRS